MYKAKFYGVCDKVRQTPSGEKFWQRMMNSKNEVSEEYFLERVDLSNLLDVDGVWEVYKGAIADEIIFYEAGNEVLFFQTMGFEFIFYTN